jgi:hypothetical protein
MSADAREACTRMIVRTDADHCRRLATVGTVDKDLLALACTFCGRSQREVRKLIAGPHVYICDACVDLAEGVASTGTAAGTQLGAVHAVPEQDRWAGCAFCGKNRDRVTGLAALAAEVGGEGSGPAAICAECLSLCREIITEELA